MAKTDFKSVDEYIAAQPEATQGTLKRVRSIIRKAVPKAEEAISYQIPAYRLPNGAVLYFAGWKQHFSLYPAKAPLVAAFKKELAPYKVSKGTIRFPLSEPVPVKLIERIAKFLAVAVLFVLLLPTTAMPQNRPVSIGAGRGGTAQLTLANGEIMAIPKEPGQVGVSAALVAPDGSAGWLAEFRAGGVSYPVAEALIVWKGGKVMQRFRSGQAFYSWAFYAGGMQVAFHTGPLHGETKSHCELHDTASGRLLASWDGDLESTTRPPWTKGLNH